MLTAASYQFEMATLSESATGTLLHSIKYPHTVKSLKEKKDFKHALLREHQETLMADYAQIGDRRTISNLLFFTNDRDAWHTAICKYYKSTKKQGICYGRQILVREEANSTPFLTVNVYHNGTVMFQGSEACLNSVQENFITIRSLAETEKQENT